MKENKQENIDQLKKEIVIERIRQASPNVSVSFGMSDGKFMKRDELIKNIEDNTDIGNRIVEIQLNYLKAFKRGFLVKQ